jgi:pimeloyl-ACP methyl ester carboxylesterase
VPLDTDVLTEDELNVYAAALQRSGFFGPDSYYMNLDRNADYARRAKNGGRIDLPVLFLHGEYDYTCETVASRLAEMRRDCRNLSEVVIRSGHWMAQEKPIEVNASIAQWLANAVPAV